MGKCRYAGCDAEATVTLEVMGPNGLLMDEAGLCAPCRKKFLEGWRRMQAEAGALRDRGVPNDELNRIMSARVEAGEF